MFLRHLCQQMRPCLRPRILVITDRHENLFGQRALSVPRVLVPAMPGALSAVGILLADTIRE